MSYEIPPDPGPDGEKIAHQSKKAPPISSSDVGSVNVRKARISDVRKILGLINGFAASNLMLPRGPQYVYENIRDFVVAVSPEAGDDRTEERIVACGSLHVLWEDMAEIRSMAIQPQFQNHGLGREIVAFMREEAQQLGVKRLFTFTLTEAFFTALGFERKDKEELSPKVWGECSRCPKYFQCDEVGMILRI